MIDDDWDIPPGVYGWKDIIFYSQSGRNGIG
jgi:hypothetical protein